MLYYTCLKRAITSFWTWSDWLSPRCFLTIFWPPAQKKNGGRQRGICGLDPDISVHLAHLGTNGDPMSCWPTIPINIICRWCIIGKFTYFVYQSVTKKRYFITHMYTSLVLKQPIAKVLGITPFQDMAPCLRMWINQWILGITPH